MYGYGGGSSSSYAAPPAAAAANGYAPYQQEPQQQQPPQQQQQPAAGGYGYGDGAAYYQQQPPPQQQQQPAVSLLDQVPAQQPAYPYYQPTSQVRCCGAVVVHLWCTLTRRRQELLVSPRRVFAPFTLCKVHTEQCACSL
jgi:hypothetical protein